MNKELYVSSTPHETRLALAEDGEIAEVYFEREKEYSLAGAIYKGRVTRVLPGMQSAFVDIGLERDAFLYVSDFFEDSDEYDRVVSEAENAVARLERPAGSPPERLSDRPERSDRQDRRGNRSDRLERRPPAVTAPTSLTPPEGGEEATAATPTVDATLEAAAAAPSDSGEAVGNDPNRRGHRRGRHRGRRGRNVIPDAKFAEPGDNAAPTGADGENAPPLEWGAEEATEPANTAASAPPASPRARPTKQDAPVAAAYPALVLPGESLAKYRGAPPPATGHGACARGARAPRGHSPSRGRGSRSHFGLKLPRIHLRRAWLLRPW